MWQRLAEDGREWQPVEASEAAHGEMDNTREQQPVAREQQPTEDRDLNRPFTRPNEEWSDERVHSPENDLGEANDRPDMGLFAEANDRPERGEGSSIEEVMPGALRAVAMIGESSIDVCQGRHPTC